MKHTHRAAYLLALALATPVCAENEPLTRAPNANLAAIKTKAFSTGNAAFLTTLLGKPFVLTRSEFMGVNRRLELFNDLGNAYLHNNFGVKKEVMLGYCACIKHERKMAGGHKSVIGEKMGSTLSALGAIPENTYNEHPIVELYVQEVPMMWQLRSAKEFSSVRKAVVIRFEELGVTPQKNAVLLVTIADDPSLATLSVEDNEFIRKWFALVDLEDKESRDYFRSMQKQMNEENYTLEGSHPQYALETIPETLFRMFESSFGEFEPKKLVPIMAATVGGMFMKDLLTGPATEIAKKLVSQTKAYLAVARNKTLQRLRLQNIVDSLSDDDYKKMISGIRNRR